MGMFIPFTKLQVTAWHAINKTKQNLASDLLKSISNSRILQMVTVGASRLRVVMWKGVSPERAPREYEDSCCQLCGGRQHLKLRAGVGLGGIRPYSQVRGLAKPHSLKAASPGYRTHAVAVPPRKPAPAQWYQQAELRTNWPQSIPPQQEFG